jgi:hypothetical protein
LRTSGETEFDGDNQTVVVCDDDLNPTLFGVAGNGNEIVQTSSRQFARIAFFEPLVSDTFSE